MSDHDLDLIRSQIELARRHLEQASVSAADLKAHHLAEARRAREVSVSLLPALKIIGTQRVELVTELARLTESLLQAGVDI